MVREVATGQSNQAEANKANGERKRPGSRRPSESHSKVKLPRVERLPLPRWARRVLVQLYSRMDRLIILCRGDELA